MNENLFNVKTIIINSIR